METPFSRAACRASSAGRAEWLGLVILAPSYGVTRKQHAAELSELPTFCRCLGDESYVRYPHGMGAAMNRVALISTVIVGVGFAHGALAADLPVRAAPVYQDSGGCGSDVDRVVCRRQRRLGLGIKLQCVLDVH
jgi:hypothetical protein